MNDAMRLIAPHLQHVCAVVIVATLLGSLRFVRAQRPALGPSVASQLLLVVWLVLLVVATYALPAMGIWGVGVVVPLLADHHAFAWLTGQVGAKPVIQGLQRVVRKAGPVRFVLATIPQQALHAAIGLILVTVSGGRNAWEYWLGYGILSGAALGVFANTVAAIRLARIEGFNGEDKAA